MAVRVGVRTKHIWRGAILVKLCADGLKHALLDEAEQFGFDVVAGELERELLHAFTVTRLHPDSVDGLLDGRRRRPIGTQVDACARPLT